MAKLDLEEQIKKVLELAEQNGVANNFFFSATFADWKRLRVILAKIGKRLDEQGSVVDGKVNPLVNEYSKTAQSAAKLAFELMKMVTGKDSPTAETNKNECPDFERMDTKVIGKWCKKYDLDPNDYSRQMLVRALTKRWKFDNE